jgi:sterol desaturase/sphingolipid hydroxylase (fatty acid hydroxylase superfamily)
MELSFIARHFGGGFVSLSLFSDNPPLTLVISVAAFLFVQDFFFYLWHRAEHKVRSLWDIHAVHHSEQRLNGTSYMRQNWVDGVLQTLFVNIPVVLLLNVSTEAQYDSYLIAAAWNFFGHADIRLELGILTPILTGPQLHRLHHSVLVKHHDKNFAQFFPVWDRLFGTYVAPEPGEFPPTGLASGEKIESLKLMVSWPFQQWATCFSRRQPRAASRVRAYRL